MAGPIVLRVANTELTGDRGMEWNMSCSEILGATGRATLVIQDRLNNYEPPDRADIKLSIRTGPLAGWVLFRGVLGTPELILPTGHTYREWHIDASDYSIEFPFRKIGALDGKKWQDLDNLGIWINIDPDAHYLKTDKLSIAHFFDKYMRLPDGTAIDATSLVNEYVADLPSSQIEFSDLQQVIADLARLIAQNVQGWLDPDLKYHWVAVPAWQDLLQEGPGGIDPEDPESGSGEGQPEIPPPLGLDIAPYYISDARNYEDPFQLGCSDLRFKFDETEMVKQAYIRGGTGYTYNAPPVNPVEESVVISPDDYDISTAEVFKLTFLATTRVWTRAANGLLTGAYITVPAGGPFNVKWLKIPWNSAVGKGGHFWQLLEGPQAGTQTKYVDNDTDYFGYGSIRVVRDVEVTVPPKVGIGGSGWTNEVTQDKTKRQVYVEAAISTTRAKRDQIGNQVLYRGEHPTLRGSLKVRGQRQEDGSHISADGWRVGQYLIIFDQRLPAAYNGQYYIIQQVESQLMEGTEVREYTLHFGDGPESRWSMEEVPSDEDVRWPPGVDQIVIDERDLAPGPNSTQIIKGQLVNKIGAPWRIAGKAVKWELLVKNNTGATITGQGTLVPSVSFTDNNGIARTKLTTGSMTGLVYYVFANVVMDE